MGISYFIPKKTRLLNVMVAAKIELKSHQKEALSKIKNGNILVGGVGSGKTYTSIFWYIEQFKDLGMDLIVITTAANRDMIKPGQTKPDWHQSIEDCGVTDYKVDSWNNLHKYAGTKNTCFIFDEQRVVGYGKWAKAFINLTWEPTNRWILLSATPGDNWMDYIPVFIANKLYLNKTEFVRKHVEQNPYVSYFSVKAYKGTAVLEKHRKSIVVTMEVERHTTRHREYISCDYDKELYKQVARERFNIFKDEPIETPPEFMSVLRRIVNASDDRINYIRKVLAKGGRYIVFYNFNYELDILRSLCDEANYTYSEWNGHKHDSLPTTDNWLYLVQYTAGSEGWNCTDTNQMIFYSVNHAYKKMEQAEGRIDRMNTPFTDLYYTYLTSDSLVDKSILDAVQKKKRFNETMFVRNKYHFIPIKKKRIHES